MTLTSLSQKKRPRGGWLWADPGKRCRESQNSKAVHIWVWVLSLAVLYHQYLA